MKERPILFSGEMVCAILEGRKTQTRRVIKPQPTKFPTAVTSARWLDAGFSKPGFYAYTADNDKAVGWWRDDCPYGKPGDQLWVRESWAVDKRFDHLKPSDLPGKAYQAITYFSTDESIINPCSEYQIGRTRSSRFMPRWASRIQLEITDIRVERLQDISAQEAIYEGVENPVCLGCQKVMTLNERDTNTCANCGIEPLPNYKRAFTRLWDSINAARGFGWDANPWVWVIKFKVVK